jgi:hypothetical protein
LRRSRSARASDGLVGPSGGGSATEVAPFPPHAHRGRD